MEIEVNRSLDEDLPDCLKSRMSSQRQLTGHTTVRRVS
jgi:hypothetical protein